MFIWRNEMAENNSFNNSDRVFVDESGVKRKILRVIEATATNIHHIISRKQKDKFNVHDERNKMTISMRVHDALNRLYWDKQTPRKQLAFMLDIRKPVLSPWVKQALFDILELPDDVFYHQELIKCKKNKNIGTNSKT